MQKLMLTKDKANIVDKRTRTKRSFVIFIISDTSYILDGSFSSLYKKIRYLARDK